ncbi:DnaJ domain-containing protein [Xylaria arbuscula]|nr:DnaJ domain-containing protein [Xylaria arbuscula]
MGAMELQPPSCVDHYADLGVLQDASTQEIRRAFYKLAKETHPDKNNNESTHTARFRKAQEAYECLCDATRRQIYDEKYPAILEEWARYNHQLSHPNSNYNNNSNSNSNYNNFFFANTNTTQSHTWNEKGWWSPFSSTYPSNLSEQDRAEAHRVRMEEFRRRMEEGLRRMEESSRRAREESTNHTNNSGTNYRKKMAGCNRTMDDFFARWQGLQFPFASSRCGARAQMSSPLWSSMSSGPFMSSMRI